MPVTIKHKINNFYLFLLAALGMLLIFFAYLVVMLQDNYELLRLIVEMFSGFGSGVGGGAITAMILINRFDINIGAEKL